MTAPKDEPNRSGDSSAEKPEDAADLAQAYRELARGEQAATALEANLTNLESKLDAMLAAFEVDLPEETEEGKHQGQKNDDKDEQNKGKANQEGSS